MSTGKSTSPTSSSPPPLSLNGEQGQIHLNGNGILADLQTTFPPSSWSHGIDSFDLQANSRMFEPQENSPAPLMQVSYQQVSSHCSERTTRDLSLQAVQRRPITAAHNFPSSQPIRSGGNPMNGRWNPQSSFMAPPHFQQQVSPSSWNQPAMPHGFPSTSYVADTRSSPHSPFSRFSSRRPPLNNPHISTGKGAANPYSFLPPSNNNSLRRTPVMGNYPPMNVSDETSLRSIPGVCSVVGRGL